MPLYGLDRSEKVRKADDYRRVMRKGRKVQQSHFALFYQLRDGGELRFGITVSRKVGKAFARNRLKRRIREFFRTNKHRIREAAALEQRGLDMVFLARSGAAELTSKSVAAELESLAGAMVGSIGRTGEKGSERGGLA